MFAPFRAAAAAAVLMAGVAGGGVAAVASAAPAPSAAHTWPSYESLACGAPIAGLATCNAIQLLSPSQYWAPGTWSHNPGTARGTVRGGQAPAPPGSGYYPADFESAYNLAVPAGKMSPGPNAPTVAIVDAYDDPNAASDLSAYRTSMNAATDPNTGLVDPAIPPLCSSTVVSGCITFKKLSQTGSTTSYPSGNSGWSEEISLDLDTVSAVCPDCNIDLVEASTSSLSNLAAAVSEAESLHPVVITNSYGGSESSSETSMNNVYSATTSTAITAAAGDSGFGVEFPAASPGLTAVGGTSLSYSGTGSSLTWQPQSVWSDSGSGCSTVEGIPEWQASSLYDVPATCSGREVTDISADANPQTGFAAYDTYGESGWLVFGGTSLSTQVIGAAYAVASTTGTIKALPQDLYTGTTPNALGLVPVTSGSNGSCGNYLCNAADTLSGGYNGPSGLGTPNGVSALATASVTSGSLRFSPTSDSLSAGGVAGPVTVSLSSPQTSNVTVALSTTSSGGSFSNSATGTFSSTSSLSIAAGSTSASFYYKDTVAGSPTVTASASGWTSATLPVTVSAGPLAKITVSPASASVAEGATQVFTATGSDAYGNAVTVNATWATNISGASVSSGSGSSTTFTAGPNTGSGTVTATEGSVVGSASVTVTATPALRVTVTAGSVSTRGGDYDVPITVTADNSSTGAGVSGASALLDVYQSASCSGTVAASGTFTTGSNGQLSVTFQTPTATTWCLAATVTASGYTSGSGQDTFSS